MRISQVFRGVAVIDNNMVSVWLNIKKFYQMMTSRCHMRIVKSQRETGPQLQICTVKLFADDLRAHHENDFNTADFRPGEAASNPCT
mmetsp:Transcript_129854/g.238819  ORF Transcript_129854/g.238819 Transcript_129854/m.238819 type:complete len:87 (-) Transcript_129854:920-1180(-)